MVTKGYKVYSSQNDKKRLATTDCGNVARICKDIKNIELYTLNGLTVCDL